MERNDAGLGGDGIRRTAGSAVSRRTLLGSAAFVLGGHAFAGAAPSRRRPNIILAIADDWSWLSARTTNDAALNLPTFARLRREGVAFDNAFAPAPSCSASRASLLSGQAPWRLEEGMNLAGTFDAKFPVYPEILEKSGYHVGFAGKGWAPGDLKAGRRTRNPAGDTYKDFGDFIERRPKDAPFCFWFGSSDPHRVYDVDSGRRGGLDPAQVKVPPYLPDVPEIRSDMNDYRFAVQRFDRDVGRIIDALATMGELDNTLIVMTGDNGWPFPRSKATLYDSGTHVPLVLRWSGVERPGRIIADFVSLTDLAPTFLDLAGTPPSAAMTGKSLAPYLAGADTMHRTFAITAMERHMDTRAVIGHGYPMRAIRTADHLYIRNFAPTREPAGPASIHPREYGDYLKDYYAGYGDIDPGQSKAYLITHKDDPAIRPFFERATALRPATELYDVRHDPYQLHNLAGRPGMAGVVQRLDKLLMAELRRTRDPRALGETDRFDRYPIRPDPGWGRPSVI